MHSPLHTEHIVDLEPGETVLLEVRRHMIVFYARLLVLVGLFFVPLLLSPLIVKGVNLVTQEAVGSLVFGFLFALWLLLLWCLFFHQWTDYYLDVWVITNKRLFDVKQNGFFARNISTCRLEHIQDVTIDIDGIVPTFFKYGTVHIHTAGESHDFILPHANDPVTVKNALMEAHGKTIDASGSSMLPGR